MKKIIFIVLFFNTIFTFSQEKTVKFSMFDIIQIAHEQAPDAIVARNNFRASYWQFRSYQAAYLPSLYYSGTLPYFNRAIVKNTNKVTMPDGTIRYEDDYAAVKNITTSSGFTISQNIGLTGGTISINSNLERNDQLTADRKNYLSTPVNLSLTQPLFGYNRLKWNKKIQPLVYDEAKKNYIDAMENVSIKAMSRFFDLVLSQLNLRIAQINYNNSDTLYKISQGRFNIGTIAQNDLYQMELSFLSSKTALKRAEIDLESSKSRLRSFLGYNEKMNFELQLPDSIPSFIADYDKVLELAKTNNPDVLSRRRRLLEAKQAVAQAQGARRNINLNASVGLTKTDPEFSKVYDNPQDKQTVRLGIEMPIIDWGEGRGKVKMAKSREELVNVQVTQEEMDFEQNIYLQVMQFNIQNDMVIISAKSDTIAQSRYDVTKQRFVIGRVDVLNLNDALKEKDSAKRGYISSLRDYWNNYYQLRSLTLFDFVTNQPLDADYEKLVE